MEMCYDGNGLGISTDVEMLEFFPCLNILHCGGEEERKFIAYLHEIIAISEDAALMLEYTEFQEQQDRKELVYHDAKKYESNGMPVVLLISKEFFKLMWTCSHKKALLEIITSENLKHCLHIWLDVSESEVKGYSRTLLSQNHNFKRVKSCELASEASTVITTIRKLLQESADKSLASDNYAIDDDEEKMRANFFESHGDLVQDILPNAAGPSKKKKKKKGNVYSDALRIASMSAAELEAYANSSDNEDIQSNSRR